MCMGHGPKPVYVPGSMVRLDEYEGAGPGVEQRIKRALARDAGRHRRAWRQVCVSPVTWNILQSSLAARGHRPVSVQISGFGFAAISLIAATGKVDILSDVHVPDGSLCFLKPDMGWSGGGIVVDKFVNFGPFWSPPYPGGAGEPLPAEPKPAAPAQCSKCKEPFPYEAHESGKCYRCRNET